MVPKIITSEGRKKNQLASDLYLTFVLLYMYMPMWIHPLGYITKRKVSKKRENLKPTTPRLNRMYWLDDCWPHPQWKIMTVIQSQRSESNCGLWNKPSPLWFPIDQVRLSEKGLVSSPFPPSPQQGINRIREQQIAQRQYDILLPKATWH